jgi:transcriptional regulator of aromatic amino acid metabolism
MITVNCTVLLESLLDSELFGQMKAAFIRAARDRAGHFEEAEGVLWFGLSRTSIWKYITKCNIINPK